MRVSAKEAERTPLVLTPSQVSHDEISLPLAFDDHDIPAVARSRVKRLVDVGLALFALVVLLPALALVTLAICVTSGWPPLYSQTRLGLGGRPFRMWKFRTMVRDADALWPQVAALNEAPFPAFKVRRDPRVTAVGRVLRRSSLDELPQIVNVIAGEMSLVGPRPPLPREVQAYDVVALRRLRARPGITGLWQVEERGRAGTSWESWISLDLQYIDRWDHALDATLIARTLWEVVRMSGH
ncbi:MAG: sugar transferase [Chloroflexota bacterium]|nr:sugar transferase [Chloroflexota bacterium]